jgi:hypothetical protein
MWLRDEADLSVRADVKPSFKIGDPLQLRAFTARVEGDDTLGVFPLPLQQAAPDAVSKGYYRGTEKTGLPSNQLLYPDVDFEFHGPSELPTDLLEVSIVEGKIADLAREIPTDCDAAIFSTRKYLQAFNEAFSDAGVATGTIDQFQGASKTAVNASLTSPSLSFNSDLSRLNVGLTRHRRRLRLQIREQLARFLIALRRPPCLLFQRFLQGRVLSLSEKKLEPFFRKPRDNALVTRIQDALDRHRESQNCKQPKDGGKEATPAEDPVGPDGSQPVTTSTTKSNAKNTDTNTDIELEACNSQSETGSETHAKPTQTYENQNAEYSSFWAPGFGIVEDPRL